MNGSEARNLQLVQGGAMPTLNVTNDEKLTAIRDTVAKGATDAEFTMLMHLANTYQLDPFLKEIWFIKYGNTPTIMVSRDGLRNYAQRQGDLLGMISQEVRQGDTFKYNPITGQIQHEISDGSGPITKAYCIIKREGKPDHTEIVDFLEYFNALSGKNAVWKSHPSAMIKKVVEVLALKKCYTITGLYAPEEMGLQNADMIDVTPQEERQKSQQQPQNNGEKDKNATLRRQLFATAREKGITDDELKETIFALFGKTSTKDLTRQEFNQLITNLKSYKPVGNQTEHTEQQTDQNDQQTETDPLNELDPDTKYPWEE